MLRDNGETMTSSKGTFELGFFSPENSRNRYVGIWYKRITAQTIVWVANRDSPIPETSSATLRVVDQGLLVLVNHKNGTVWSTNTSRTVHNPIAQLLDSGNLVCDPTGYPHKVLKRGREVRYRSGPLSGPGSSLRANSIFKFGLVMNENEVYYHYELFNNSVISRFTLTEGGVGQRSVWVDRTHGWVVYLTAPTDNCDIYRACGSYGICRVDNSPVCGCLDKFTPNDPRGWDRGDWSNGCARRTPLDCENGDGFLKYSGVKLPDTQNSWFSESMSLKECKELCSRNCSCTAYTSLDIGRGGRGCLLWFGELVDIREISPGADIYIRMASSELVNNSTGLKGRKGEIIIVTLSLVIGIVLLSLSLMLYSWKRRKVHNQQIEKVSGHNKNLELPLFDLSTLTKATDNFSTNNKLGEGGYGPVYKGFLEDGQEIAVKRLSTTSHQGVDEFKNEVICTAKLQHRNLVKLLGCCIQGEDYMLVYEYLTNKSLNLILFDPMKSMLLDWPRRLNIINGIARGLMYLHQDSRLRIIHRDLKASNILLDSDMNPKISDFGLARAFGGNETGAKTKRVVGTYGYMSPEYAVDGVFSVKSDVFSFGVLVLEIVSGKRNREFSHRDHSLNLLGHAWMLYKDERSLELVDSDLRNSYNISEVIRATHIGLLCVQEFPDNRPTMSSVVLMLSNETVLPQAKQPGFFTARQTLTTENSDISDAASSTNKMSVTMLVPR
ncbi:g-type lectin s-receptor-like serine/threonine-protein kinase at4g27290 [Phtheirospermum japonicum]|uniref:Receptor-like serine/threonine-protein kinase n=1 Tax=Phtheirospermum japonicum TaxID=374723 RepID=A0A830BY76_9LAMI|nr:g-type lectin s-receptor-like serine/threonine-protein kinase at4g27290 [Phtheirospermum japonicum]